MPTWPSIENPSTMIERTKKGQIKSDFEAGHVQSRAKWTRSRKIFELSWPAMSDTDKNTLESFFKSNIGGTFTWTYPPSLAESPPLSYTVRFTDDELRAEYVSANFWQVSVTLEEQ